MLSYTIHKIATEWVGGFCHYQVRLVPAPNIRGAYQKAEICTGSEAAPVTQASILAHGKYKHDNQNPESLRSTMVGDLAKVNMPVPELGDGLDIIMDIS